MGPRSHPRRRPTAVVAVGILALGLVIGALVGAAWGSTRPPSYAATATLMVALPGNEGTDELDSLRGRAVLAPVFATIAVTPDAVGRVTDELGIGDDAAAVLAETNARAEEGSAELSITARYHDASLAAAIANDLAADLIARTGGTATGTLLQIGRATPPETADRPATALAVAIGGIVGLAVAAGVVVAWTADGRRRDVAVPASGVAAGVEGHTTGSAAEPAPATDARDILLGALLGIGVLVAMALQLPGPLALGASALAVGAAALLPGAGFAALIVLLPHQEPEILGAIGVKLPILLALGYGLAVRMLARREVPRVGLGVLTIAGLLGIAFVSAVPAINGLEGDRAVASAARFLQFADGLILLVLAAVYFRRRDAVPFVVLTLLSVTFACLMAVFQLVAGNEPIPLLTGLYVGGLGQGLERVVGPFFNPNYFGLFAGLGVVLAIGVAVEAPRHRRLALLCLPILALAVMGTLSRGGVAATGVGILAWLWFRNRQLALVIGAAAVVAGLVVTPLLVQARLDASNAAAVAAAQAGISDSDQERFESVAAGTSLFLLDPVFGVGFGQYEYVSPRFVGNSFATSAHNQYLKILAEQGMVGTALYVVGAAALLVAMRGSGSRWRRTAIAMLAVYAVSGLFLEPLTTFQTSGVLWLVLGIVVAGPAVEPRPIGVAARAAALRIAQATPRRSPAV
jgi:O-antigen ligase/capsular polysaccharide biosynthesis protein